MLRVPFLVFEHSSGWPHTQEYVIRQVKKMRTQGWEVWTEDCVGIGMVFEKGECDQTKMYKVLKLSIKSMCI